MRALGKHYFVNPRVVSQRQYADCQLCQNGHLTIEKMQKAAQGRQLQRQQELQRGRERAQREQDLNRGLERARDMERTRLEQEERQTQQRADEARTMSQLQRQQQPHHQLHSRLSLQSGTFRPQSEEQQVYAANHQGRSHPQQSRQVSAASESVNTVGANTRPNAVPTVFAQPTTTDVPNELACIVCADERKCVMATPCNHVLYCEPCSLRAAGTPFGRNCAQCRAPISNFVRIYL
jgi:hypothetical protein